MFARCFSPGYASDAAEFAEWLGALVCCCAACPGMSENRKRAVDASDQDRTAVAESGPCANHISKRTYDKRSRQGRCLISSYRAGGVFRLVIKNSSLAALLQLDRYL